METSHNPQREMGPLEGKIAVVTGATAGVGRGIASELAQRGARVFVTGRSVQDGKCDDSLITEIRCDHREDEQVAAAFARVAQETGAIDILVNNVWGGYEGMMEDGVFTWSKPFWEQPLWRWDAMFEAGVRAHYYASQLAARSMVGHRRGLIVNISFWATKPPYLSLPAVLPLNNGRDGSTKTSGSPAWIRTTIHGSKGRCPTIRRPGILRAGDLFSVINLECRQAAPSPL
jgi:hypothetical protein